MVASKLLRDKAKGFEASNGLYKSSPPNKPHPVEFTAVKSWVYGRELLTWWFWVFQGVILILEHS